MTNDGLFVAGGFFSLFFFSILPEKVPFFPCCYPFFTPQKNQEKKKKRKKQSKIQEDTHEEKPKELSKLMVKDQNDK
jgi:hypothetical protein